MRRPSHTLLRIVFWAGLVLLLLAIARAVTAGQTALPGLALDRFPAEARQSIASAYREAQTDARDAAAAGRLGMVLQSWEQWTAALTAYQRAQSLSPTTFDWWYLAGIVESRIGKPADATRSFARATELAPTYIPARLKLAEALFDTGNLAASANAYEALARAEAPSNATANTQANEAPATAKAPREALNPTATSPASDAATPAALAAAAAAPAVQYGLGRIKAAQGDTAGAAGHFEEACRLFPEFGAAHYALALVYRKLGRGEDAQREMSLHQRYTNAWPGVEDPVAARIAPLRDDARAHMDRGIAAWKAGRLDEAIKEHEEAVRLQPSLAQAHANLIILYGRAQNRASAEAHYRAVVALNSNLGEAHYNYGVLLMEQKQADAAIEAFKQALVVNPHNAPAHANLGLLLETRRDFAGAEEQYRLALQDDPSSPAARVTRFNHGRMLIALGRLDDAIAAFEKLQPPSQTQSPSQDPRANGSDAGSDANADADAPRYRYALAAAHLRAGHRDRGLTLAREARALAERFGQTSLVASIDRDLASIGADSGGNH